MRRRASLLALILCVTAGAVPPEAAAAPLPASGTVVATASATPVALPVLALPSLFGSPGLNNIRDHVADMARDYRADFMQWGTTFYVFFFVIQFLLLGITMVVKGPFAIASYRPIHALNPFANFFFFLLAGTLGFLLVSNSVVITSATSETGWMPWLYDWFSELGEETGCTETYAFGLGNPCSEEQLAWIGMRISGLMLAIADLAGLSDDNQVSWLVNSSSSMSVTAAFSALAIQLTLIKIAFILTIVSAPIFLSTIVFKPFSGIADGFVSFVIYLGVKLFILKLVAGIAGYVAAEWFQALATDILLRFLVGGTFSTGDMFGFNLTVLTTSLLFLSLILYLPTKVAGMVSQRMNIDLNGILFRGEFPVQIA